MLTQPDRPKGRGLSLVESAVKQLAARRGLPMLQPGSLKTDTARAPLFTYPLDVLVVAAYGLILPEAVLAWPRHGCLNVHASRLPRWRGAAPIQRALLAGDLTTGVTIMQMNAGLDTGPVIAGEDVAIEARESAHSLEAKLALAGAELIVAALHALSRDGVLHAVPQPPTGATYAGKIERTAAAIDWTRSAIEIDRLIRAFDPAPGAHTEFNGASVKVWGAHCIAVATPAAPGTVIAVHAEGIDVGCGEQALRLTSVQPAGGRKMPAVAFAAGRACVPGALFGAPHRERG